MLTKKHMYIFATLALSIQVALFSTPALINTAHFPQKFLWGAATSAHQAEGNSTNNTFFLAEQKHMTEKTCDEMGNRIVTEYAGTACDHYNRCFDDIALLKQAGLNTYRFSIAWEKVEPSKENFDHTVIKHYADFCVALVKENITPAITLHHYTEPIWFAHMGGFLQEFNINTYVEYAQTIIREILNALDTARANGTISDAQHNQHRPLWLTFNSPTGYAVKCYFQGIMYPFEKGNLHNQTRALKNMLSAHVRTYRTVKAALPTAYIGILHNIYQTDPYRPWNPADILACKIADNLVNNCVYNFFTKGMFNVYVPFKVKIYHTDYSAIGALDFIGLNYYSHTYMKNFKTVPDMKLKATNNPNYRVYPEGLYRAIKELSEKMAHPLHLPIYITENGIGTDDNALREEFLAGYLNSLSRAIADGYNVRGYIHWALMDNYEWGTYHKRYGMFAVNWQTQERALKQGARYYVDVITRYNAQHA